MLINHNCNLKLYSYFYSYIFGSLTFHMYIFYCISFPVLLVPPLTIYPPTVFCFCSYYTVLLFPPLFYLCVLVLLPIYSVSFPTTQCFYFLPYSIAVFPLLIPIYSVSTHISISAPILFVYSPDPDPYLICFSS